MWEDVKPAKIMETIIETNYRAHVKLTSLFIPLLSQDGKIINVGSTTGRMFVYDKNHPEWKNKENYVSAELELVN